MLTSNKFILYLQSFLRVPYERKYKINAVCGINNNFSSGYVISTLNLEVKAEPESNVASSISRGGEKLAKYHKNFENWFQNQARISLCHKAVILPIRFKSFRNPVE